MLVCCSTYKRVFLPLLHTPPAEGHIADRAVRPPPWSTGSPAAADGARRGRGLPCVVFQAARQFSKILYFRHISSSPREMPSSLENIARELNGVGCSPASRGPIALVRLDLKTSRRLISSDNPRWRDNEQDQRLGWIEIHRWGLPDGRCMCVGR